MKFIYPHNLIRRICLSLLVVFVSSVIGYSQPTLIGVTGEGGVNSAGVIYEYNVKTGVYYKRFDFTLNLTLGTGSNGFLIQATNGKLYGTSAYVGAYDYGILFEFDLSANTYTKKIDFDGVGNGSDPIGSLVQAANGKLYGVTSFGGNANGGVLFEYDIVSNTLEKIIDFGGENGSTPSGGLIQASNDKLYGLVRSGGANNNGLLFEYDIETNSFAKKFDFDETFPVNSDPMGNLVQAFNGKLYGLRLGFGLPPWQTTPGSLLFEYDLTANKYEEKYVFDYREGPNFNVKSGLINASNGKLYGIGNGPYLEFAPGIFLNDVLFEYNISNEQFQIVRYFEGPEYMPTGTQLIHASNGILYGVSSSGGTNNKGVLFEYKPATGSYGEKKSFNGSDGQSPFGRLLELSVVSGISTVELTSNDIQLFPNPTKGLVFINCEKGGGRLSVINSLGQTIAQQNISDNSTELNLSEFDEGVYYVRLQQNKGVAIMKVVKQ